LKLQETTLFYFYLNVFCKNILYQQSDSRPRLWLSIYATYRMPQY